MARKGETVEIVGLQSTIAAIRRIDRGFAKETQHVAMEKLGRPVAADVQSKIYQEGLRKTGRLHDSIKPSFRSGRLYIRSTPALNPGSRSPRGYAPIYEYGHHGARAFMQPVMNSWIQGDKAVHAMEEVLDWAARQWGV